MTLRRLAGLLVAALWMSLTGCNGPRTQVVVVIDADATIRAQTASVRLEVWRFDDTRRGVRLNEPVGMGGSVPWPFQTVLTPLNNDATRRYEVSATAIDSMGRTLVVSRAISGYTPGDTRVLRLFLEDACRVERAPVCDATAVCNGGVCAPIFREPSGLPTLITYNTDAGPADAYLAPGTDAFGLDAWVPDAWTPDRPDAGIDAFMEPVDAGIDAFVEPPDAFVPSARFTRIMPLPLPTTVPLFNLGATVATSDGNAIAVGAPGAGDYLYDVRSSAPPRRLNFIDPFSVSISCGQGAAINSAGTVAAFGCPATSQFVVWNGPAWDAPAGRSATGLMGHTVAMDDAGTVLAIVGPGMGSSDISIARASGGWVAVQTRVLGTTPIGLDLNDAGTVLVLGLVNASTSQTEVRTYDVTGTTVAQTDVLSGELNAGVDALALSGDGLTLAVGYRSMSLGPAVNVYRRAGMVWSLQRTVAGIAGLGLYGTALAVNANGTRVAVGAPGEGASCTGICPAGSMSEGTGSGAVYVYDGDGNLLNYIRPLDNLGSAFGFSVALNRSGSRLVIGEPSRAGGGAVYVVE